MSTGQNIYHRMTGQVNKTCEGENIMNIKSATAARLLAGVAQFTNLSNVYPRRPQYLSHFPHGNAVMFVLYKQQKCSLRPRKLLIVLYHFCSLQT